MYWPGMMPGMQGMYPPQPHDASGACAAAAAPPGMMPPPSMPGMMHPPGMMAPGMMPPSSMGWAPGMMAPGMMAPGMMPPPSMAPSTRSRSRSRDRPALRRRGSSPRNKAPSRDAGVAEDPDCPKFPDDYKCFSSAYKHLGCQWDYGEKIITRRSYRQTLLVCCDQQLFAQCVTSQLSEDQLDMLIFCVSGMSPRTLIRSIGASTKRALRLQIRSRYKDLQRRNPQRLQMLAENFANLGQVAMQLGYAVEDLRPEYRVQYGEGWRMRQRMIASPEGFGANGSGQICNGIADPGASAAPVDQVAQQFVSAKAPARKPKLALVDAPLASPDAPLAMPDAISYAADAAAVLSVGSDAVVEVGRLAPLPAARGSESVTKKIVAKLPPFKLPAKAPPSVMRSASGQQQRAGNPFAPASASESESELGEPL